MILFYAEFECSNPLVASRHKFIQQYFICVVRSTPRTKLSVYMLYISCILQYHILWNLSSSIPRNSLRFRTTNLIKFKLIILTQKYLCILLLLFALHRSVNSIPYGATEHEFRIKIRYCICTDMRCRPSCRIVWPEISGNCRAVSKYTIYIPFVRDSSWWRSGFQTCWKIMTEYFEET